MAASAPCDSVRMLRTRGLFVGLGLVMVVVVVVATATRSGTESFAALGVFAAVSAAFLLWRGAPIWAAWALYTAAAAAVVVLYALVSATPLALFFLAAAATWQEPRRRIAATLAAATVAHLIVQLLLGQDTLLTALATATGVAFLFLVARLLLSEREQRERVAQLLVEVEQRRQSERATYLMAERGRMARELHDVLAHTLSGLAIQLEGARILAANETTAPALREAVDNAHSLSRAGLQEARRAVAALRGDQLPGPDLIPTLVEEHRLSASGPVRFTITGSPRVLDAEASLALYRTAQEALSNVRKHAVGAAVDMQLEWAPDAVVLTVEDSGGTELSATGGPGFGLTGMSERAGAIGASLEAGPLASGFRVRLTVPCGSLNEADDERRGLSGAA